MIQLSGGDVKKLAVIQKNSIQNVWTFQYAHLDNQNDTTVTLEVSGLTDKSNYEIRFTNLDGSNEQTATVQKDTSLAYICFSFDNGIADIQSKKENWDLLFTKYSTMLTTDDGEPYPYLVTGVLLNPYNSTVANDTINNFETLSFEIAEKEDYSDRQDIIGYHWKEYDFDNDRYITLTDKIYI